MIPQTFLGGLLSPRSRRALFLSVVIIYLALGFFLTRTLIPSDDEESYLALGYLAVTGEISVSG